MNDTLKMYGSTGSEIMNRYFVVATCSKRQPRWRRLQTINMRKNIPKLQKITCKLLQTINSLFWFDNDFGIESKYHRKTVVLLLIAQILSLQDVVLRSMFSLIFY